MPKRRSFIAGGLLSVALGIDGLHSLSYGDRVPVPDGIQFEELSTHGIDALNTIDRDIPYSEMSDGVFEVFEDRDDVLDRIETTDKISNFITDIDFDQSYLIVSQYATGQAQMRVKEISEKKNTMRVSIVVDNTGYGLAAALNTHLLEIRMDEYKPMSFNVDFILHKY